MTTEIVYDMSNEQYHSDKRVCSSLLKAALLSQAHIETFLTGKKKTTDAMLVGTAVHCYYLERERFEAEFKVETECYAKNYGEHKAGDPKLDEDGEPLQSLLFPTGEIIKGESYKKFKGMCKALDECQKAQDLLVKGKTEVSIFGEKERVRPDLLTNDGWIVDVKTVGGLSEMALEPQEFAKVFWSLGYDLQMYMYTKLCKEAGIDVKGFIFLCVDGKEPCGCRIFYFTDESDWMKMGKHRYNVAWSNFERYKTEQKHVKYDEVVIKDLPIPFMAINDFAEVKDKE